MDKIVLLKTGWCDAYDGDEVHGDFGWIKENGGFGAHEKFNFRKDPDLGYCGYCPPIGKYHAAPRPPDPSGWTVIWVAKKGSAPGVRIVGVYEDAHFEDDYIERTVDGEKMSFCVRAPTAYVVPAAMRNVAFPSPVKSGPCVYVRGGRNDKKYTALAKKLEKAVADIKAKAASPVYSEVDREVGFADNEHIRAVELASVDFVIDHFKKKGYEITDRQKDRRIGYDLMAVKKKEILLLEVKGTSGDTPCGYMTASEVVVQKGPMGGQWRLCMVTEALGKPKMRILTAKDFDGEFALEPIAYRFVRKKASDI